MLLATCIGFESRYNRGNANQYVNNALGQPLHLDDEKERSSRRNLGVFVTMALRLIDKRATLKVLKVQRPCKLHLLFTILLQLHSLASKFLLVILSWYSNIILSGSLASSKPRKHCGTIMLARHLHNSPMIILICPIERDHDVG